MKVFLVALSVAAIVITTGAVAWRWQATRFDYGRFAPQVTRSQALLEREPCDRGAVLTLVNAKLGAGDNRGAITTSRSFLERCGELTRLREALHTAHRRLSERDEAIAEASHLLERDPYNFTYLWWRGQLHAEKGEWQKAMEDQRRSTALCPDCLGQFDLADALEELGRPCEAIEPLVTVLTLRRNVRRAPIEGRVASLRERSECQEWNGSGEARFSSERGAMLAPLRINGVELGPAVVDTGATFVSLSARDAQRVGLTGPFLDARFNTAGGARPGRITIADTVGAGALSARHVNVVIMNELAQPLLGMSFLSRFDLRLDRRGVELRARTASIAPAASR